MSLGGGLSGSGDINTLGGVSITNPTNGQYLVYDSVSGNWINSNSGGSIGYATIQGQGVSVAQETTLNFANALFTVTDDPGNNRTNVDLGTLPIANGGTGQASQTAAFDALSPTTTKGDLLANNGTHNVRVPVGTNGYVLQADSTASAGVSWVASPVGAYDTVESAGTPVTKRTILNFSGSGITAADNAGASRTDVSLASPLVDIAALSPTANSIIYGNGSNFTNNALTEQQTIYVSLNGSDTSGNGSILFPYRTLAKANTSITDAANTKKYIVVFMGGRFDESVNIVLKPYVAYVGMGGSSFTYITSPNNIIAPDSSYNNANGRSSLVNIYVGGSTGINWNLSGLGTTGSSILDLVNVQMNGGLTYIGRNLGADFLQTEGGSYWLGNTQLSNCQIQINGGYTGGTFTFDTATTTAGSQGSIDGFQFNGAITITSSGGHTNTVSITNCSVGANTMAITGGATTNVSVDVVSLPTAKSNLTITGATVNYLTDSYGLYYTPTTAGNWSVAPNNVTSALDDLASSGVFKSQVANTFLAAPNGSAGVPSFRALAAADLPSIIFDNVRYIDWVNGNDVTGDGSQQRPWKSLQHAYNAIGLVALNFPYTIVMEPGFDSVDTGPITGHPNINLVCIGGVINIPQPVTITGGSSNDVITITNVAFSGGTSFNWTRNDATEISLGLNNVEANSTFVFEQQGSGVAATFFQAVNSVFVGLTIQAGETAITGSSFEGNTITFADSGVAYAQIFGSYIWNTAISISGGLSVTFGGNTIDNTGAPITLATTTTGSGTPLIITDASSIPATITGPGSIMFTGQANYVNANYTPTYYTPVSSDVSGHLHGIDNSLASLQPFAWSVKTANTTMSGNNGYISQSASLLTFTLPAVCAVGAEIEIVGDGTGLYRIAQNAGQQIKYLGVNTTSGTGGSIASSGPNDSIKLVCATANSEFIVTSSGGLFNIT